MYINLLDDVNVIDKSEYTKRKCNFIYKLFLYNIYFEIILYHTKEQLKIKGCVCDYSLYIYCFVIY